MGLVGNKTGPSDGIMIQGSILFYGDIQYSALKQASIEDGVPFESITLGENENDFRWIDTFSDALDGSGTLYFVANHLDEYFNGTMNFESTSPNFRIYKYTADSEGDSDDYTLVLTAILCGFAGIV